MEDEDPVPTVHSRQNPTGSTPRNVKTDRYSKGHKLTAISRMFDIPEEEKLEKESQKSPKLVK